MNLSMDALRWITVRALKGRTWALNNVMDSPASPADIRIAGQRQSFIAVYCDEADTRGIEKPYLSSPPNVRLVIECGVASAMAVEQSDTPPAEDAPPAPGGTVTQINSTDSGLEAQIGFLSRQVRDALMATSLSNPWSDLWRILTNGGNIDLIEVVRGGPAADQYKPRARYASRITVLHLKLLAEPVRGDVLPPAGFWFKFLAACNGDPDLGGIGDILQSHFSTGAGPLPEWRVAQKILGLPAEDMPHLGIAPQEGGDADPLNPTEEPVAPIGTITPKGEDYVPLVPPDPPEPGVR